jgi:large subunit ribosomal protein L21
MKYAIAQVSGRQYILKSNQWYDIDYIPNSKVGDYVFLNKILFFRDLNKIQIGAPFLNKSKILVKIIQHIKGTKIRILKTKPKKHYTKKQGHRQQYTRIIISDNLI